MQMEPHEPCHRDRADAFGAEPRPAPATTVRGLVLETESVKVPDLELVKVKVRVLVLVLVLVLDWAQGWARGPLQQQGTLLVAEPSGGHRPHEPKPELRLLPHWLQELEWAPALLKREHQSHQQSVPTSARGWASVTPQPVVRTS